MKKLAIVFLSVEQHLIQNIVVERKGLVIIYLVWHDQIRAQEHEHSDVECFRFD